MVAEASSLWRQVMKGINQDIPFISPNPTFKNLLRHHGVVGENRRSIFVYFHTVLHESIPCSQKYCSVKKKKLAWENGCILSV